MRRKAGPNHSPSSVMEINCRDALGDAEEPARDILHRYARLNPDELRPLFAYFKEGRRNGNLHRALMIEQLLRWHPEAAEWEWDKLFTTSGLRRKAFAVFVALEENSEADLNTVLKEANALWDYNHSEYEEARRELDKDLMGAEPKFGELLKIEREARGDDSQYHTVYRALKRVGWPGLQNGTREGLEKLVRAILWVSPDEEKGG